MTPEEKAAHDALLQKLSENVNTEIEKRGYQNSESVKSIVNESLQGLNIEGLRSFEADKEKMELNIRNIAGELEKVKNAGQGAEKRAVTLESAIDSKMDLIERAFKSRDSKDEVKINVRAAAIMTTQNTVDATAVEGVDLENFRVDAFVPKRRDYQYIFDIADRVTVAEVPEVIIWDEEGDAEGAVAIVAEGGLKPLVSFANVRNMSEYKKAAGKVVVTEEFAKFRKRSYQIIRGLFNDKVLRDYVDILTTNLIASASSYIGTTLDDQIVAPTDYHAIGAVAAQLETLNFAPDVLIINPQDKWRMALSQDDNGAFFANVPITGANGQVQIMSFKTVTTNKIAAGTFILGEGNAWKIEDEAVTLRLGYGISMNGSTVEADFDHNRFRIIGELYFHNYIASNNNGAFVQATFNAVKSALLKP